MISYRIRERDLTAATFGVSPLSETTLSLRCVWRPQVYPHMAPWYQQVRSRLGSLDLDLLLALVAEDYSTPDFLNPRPDRRRVDFAAELRDVAALPLAIVDRDLDAIHPGGRPEALTGPTQRVLERIVGALGEYWHQCVQPWWPVLHAHLASDITMRSVAASRTGLRVMLAGLSPALTVGADELQAWNPSGPHFSADARDRGLVFVPTHFTPHVSYPFSPDALPYLLYPAIGRGDFTEAAPAAPDALLRLLGRSRALLLVSLEAPASSTEVAARRGVTVSAANQQLRWLRDAGLVSTSRHGRSLLYLQTATARALIDSLEAEQRRWSEQRVAGARRARDGQVRAPAPGPLLRAPAERGTSVPAPPRGAQRM